MTEEKSLYRDSSLFTFREKISSLYGSEQTQNFKNILKRRIVMKNLSNVWKTVIKLTAYGAAMAISYFAGEVIGEVLVDRE